MYTYVLLRNSLVVAHCCLTRDSNSAGVTGRPEANSFSPSTNLTSQNLKKHNRELMIKNYHFGLKSKPKAQNLQHAKKVMSDSAGVVDFAFGLVNTALNLPNGQVNFFGKFKLQKGGNQSCWSKRVLELIEMTCGLVHASYSLPKWQAVKLTFFAPWPATWNPNLLWSYLVQGEGGN